MLHTGTFILKIHHLIFSFSWKISLRVASPDFFLSKTENLKKKGVLLEVRSLTTELHVLSLSLHPELPGSPVSKEVKRVQ